MVSTQLPFAPREDADHQEQDLFQCPLFKTLPQGLQEGAQEHPHLMRYLHILPADDYGLPVYREELTRADGENKFANVIYPVGRGVFTHIYPDPQDARDFYISIEPGHFTDLGELMDRVERRLMDFADVLSNIETVEEKEEILLQCVDKICSVGGRGFRAGKGILGFLGRNAKGGERIPVTPAEMEAVKYFLIRDKIGLGVLEPLVLDSYIEDISCSGLGAVFVEHKQFKGLKASLTFTEFEELDDFVLRLAERIKKPATYRNPIVDAVLPDGSRINIVYGGDVSKRGSNFTIRKFSETPLSILQLCDFGSIDYTMAAYLSLVIGEGMNMFVCGETASGKTTLMNALTTFIHPSAKIVTIEDTPELQIPHPNWIREVVRGTQTEDGASGIGMFDLLKAALRQRPNAILIGEIRGEEGAVAFQAMQTGHQTTATFHAASVQKLIQRLTGDPINIPKTYIDNLNIVVIQNSVRLPGGKMGRRATSISEIVGYDSPSDSFSFIEIFRWDPVTDKFDFVGGNNSYILESKIAFKRGIPPEKKRLIYRVVARRAKILEKIHQSGVTGFHELLQVLAKAQRDEVF